MGRIKKKETSSHDGIGIGNGNGDVFERAPLLGGGRSKRHESDAITINMPSDQKFDDLPLEHTAQPTRLAAVSAYVLSYLFSAYAVTAFIGANMGDKDSVTELSADEFNDLFWSLFFNFILMGYYGEPFFSTLPDTGRYIIRDFTKHPRDSLLKFAYLVIELVLSYFAGTMYGALYKQAKWHYPQQELTYSLSCVPFNFVGCARILEIVVGAVAYLKDKGHLALPLSTTKLNALVTRQFQKHLISDTLRWLKQTADARLQSARHSESVHDTVKSALLDFTSLLNRTSGQQIAKTSSFIALVTIVNISLLGMFRNMIPDDPTDYYDWTQAVGACLATIGLTILAADGLSDEFSSLFRPTDAAHPKKGVGEGLGLALIKVMSYGLAYFTFGPSVETDQELKDQMSAALFAFLIWDTKAGCVIFNGRPVDKLLSTGFSALVKYCSKNRDKPSEKIEQDAKAAITTLATVITKQKTIDEKAAAVLAVLKALLGLQTMSLSVQGNGVKAAVVAGAPADSAPADDEPVVVLSNHDATSEPMGGSPAREESSRPEPTPQQKLIMDKVIKSALPPMSDVNAETITNSVRTIDNKKLVELLVEHCGTAQRQARYDLAASLLPAMLAVLCNTFFELPATDDAFTNNVILNALTNILFVIIPLICRGAGVKTLDLKSGRSVVAAGAATAVSIFAGKYADLVFGDQAVTGGIATVAGAVAGAAIMLSR